MLVRTQVVIAIASFSAAAVPATALSPPAIYWTDAGTDKVQRSNLDGSGVTDLITQAGTPVSIGVDAVGGRIFYGATAGQSIRRANIDGSSVGTLSVGTVDEPYGLAVDHGGGKFYWVNNDFDQIRSANLDGTGAQTVLTVSFSLGLGGLDLDTSAGKMYFTNFTNGTIERANLDGTSLETLVTGQSFPYHVALDVAGGKMYWTNNSVIRRANLDGTGLETIVTGLGDARGIDVDPRTGKIYWSDINTDRIQRANLDGSSIEDLVTSGLSTPIDLEVIPSPGAASLMILGAAITVRRRRT